MMPASGSTLPDPIVWLAPALAHGAPQFDQVRARGTVERAAARDPDECGFDEFAVHVKLQLLRGQVAHSDGARAGIPGQRG